MEVWIGFHTSCIYAGVLTDWWKASTAALISIVPCRQRTRICLGGLSWLFQTVWGGGLGLVRLRLPFCPQPLPGVSFLLFLSPHALLCPSLSWKAVPCSLRFFQSHFLHAQTWSQSPVVGSCRTVLSGMAVSFSICLTICFSLSSVIVWALRGGFRLVCH